MLYLISMKANTIKLEADLLKQIHALRPKDMSLSAFVREIIRREIVRQKLISSAEAYETMMSSNRETKAEDDAWEQANLTS